ncbi:MAG TPA: sugar phosphate isomerase/epimerase family protein [Clostridia bacterium]|nr:sugar phosphate isomerase/epimerase family protein [Clostridia bacterium]
MKKSINAWSVKSETPFEEMFAQIKAAGFEGIELNLDNPGSAHALTFDTSAGELAAIKALSEKHKLPVVSISSSLYAGNMGSADEKQRAFAAKILLRQLDLAQALGATGILVVPGGISDTVSLKTAWENSLMTLKALKKDIEAKKIFVGVENVWNCFFNSPFDMARFIDELDCKYIGAYFDVGNVAEFSDPENWIEILGNRIGKIHVKDFKRNNGTYSGGDWANLLSGSVNWPKVVPALKAAGYDGYLTAEVFKGDEDQTYVDFYTMVSEQLTKIINI